MPEIHPRRDTAQYKVLIVEDDVWWCTWLRNFLEREGFSVVEALSIAEAEKQLREEQPDVLLLDVILPASPRQRGLQGIGGVSVLEWLQHNPGIRRPEVILAVTDTPTERTARRLRELGARDVIRKAVLADDLSHLLHSYLRGESVTC